MKKYLVLAAVAASLSACAGATLTSNTVSATAVFELGEAYQAAALAETSCMGSGVCDKVATKALDTKAYELVVPLEQAAAAGTPIEAAAFAEAQAAVAAFSTSTKGSN